MKTDRWAYETLDIFVWEGRYDIADRVARFMAPFGAEVIRAGGIDFQPAEPRAKPSVAIISASVVESGGFTVLDWQAAQGMPVIVWKWSALADLVQKNHLGLVVETIGEIPGRVAALTGEEYSVMAASARAWGEKLRKGDMTRAALDNLT